MVTQKKNCVLIVKTSYDFMPLGIGYLLSMLEKNNIEFDFWDMLRPTKPNKYYLDNVRKDKYKIICTGGFVFNLNDFIKLTKKCKKINPSVPVVLGGNITRNMKPERIFQYINVDYIYFGEVEASFVEFLNSFFLKKNISDIPGICYLDKKTNKLVRNSQSRVNLAEVDVMPSYHLLDVDYYLTTNIHHRFHKIGKVMPMLTGRGCTGGCSFCSPTVGKFIAPSVRNTINEIKYLNRNYKFDGFHFITEIFFQFPYEVEEFCSEYKKLDIQKPWFCCVSPHMSHEVYPIMKDAGCVGFNMGLESGSDKILAKTKIGCTVKRFEMLYKEAKKHNLFVDVSFMVANENETQEDMRATFDTLIRNKMQMEMFGITTAYPGTSIYSKAVKRGLVKNELKYLKSVLSSRYWKIYNINEFDYMNISGIPNEKLFPVIMKEVRRYFTYLKNNFTVKNQKILDDGYSKIYDISNYKNKSCNLKLTAKCSDCGSNIETYFDPAMINYKGIIEYNEICKKCFTRNFFDILSIPSFKSHLNKLRQRIKISKKILLVGRGKIAEDILFYDFLGLDVSKIVCLADLSSNDEEKNSGVEIPKKLDDENLYFYNIKRIRKESIKNYDFDTILVTYASTQHIANLFDQKYINNIFWVNPMIDKNDLNFIYKEKKYAALYKRKQYLYERKEYLKTVLKNNLPPFLIQGLKKFSRVAKSTINFIF